MPLEMLETVLLRALLMFYKSDFERDDDRPAVILGKSKSTERRAFTLLCSVCWSWHQTLTGWMDSPTSHWVRHQMKKLIEREYTHLILAADSARAHDVSHSAVLPVGMPCYWTAIVSLITHNIRTWLFP